MDQRGHNTAGLGRADEATEQEAEARLGAMPNDTPEAAPKGQFLIGSAR